MKRSIQIACLATLSALFWLATAAAAGAGFQGRIHCGFTDYMWPSSPRDSPTATGAGTVELDADGNGKFTAGSMSEHLADDTRRFGEKNCNFRLISGEYRLTSPTAGSSTAAWKLEVGSDAHCGSYLRNLPNLGQSESARDYRTWNTTSQFFTAGDGVSHWVSAGPIGISVGTCAQTQ